MGHIKVTYYFVSIAGLEIDEAYFACGNSILAGPFMSGATAVDWQRQFSPDANIITLWGDDPDTCTLSPLSFENGKWVRS